MRRLQDLDPLDRGGGNRLRSDRRSRTDSAVTMRFRRRVPESVASPGRGGCLRRPVAAVVHLRVQRAAALGCCCRNSPIVETPLAVICSG